MHEKPNTINIAVGSRICERRRELSITQSALAEKLGMTLQQFQRAESGFDKVSASRLLRISEILDVPLMFFFRSASEDLVHPEFHLADVMAAGGVVLERHGDGSVIGFAARLRQFD